MSLSVASLKVPIKCLLPRQYSPFLFGKAPSIPAMVRTLATVAPEARVVPLGTMPPHHKATIGQLQTFDLPREVDVTAENRALGKAMIKAWRRDGILQIKMTPAQGNMLRRCFRTSKDFFKLPAGEKARHVDDQSFAGYIASGEELTDGIADYSEIFTVTKDLPTSDARVQNKWPCHGPCPWPNESYKGLMNELMALLGESGEKILRLTALGLGLANANALTNMTDDGWHHMRVLRFPEVDKTNGKGKTGRGIGSHTDYGLLVIAGQDDVGGLFVRPKIEGESIKNWQSSAAGFNENDDNWVYVPPVDDVLTVFPGKSTANLFSLNSPPKLTSDRFGRGHDAVLNERLPPIHPTQSGP
jgi:isopenicillin N synthase-like dioxygenase